MMSQIQRYSLIFPRNNFTYILDNASIIVITLSPSFLFGRQIFEGTFNAGKTNANISNFIH